MHQPKEAAERSVRREHSAAVQLRLASDTNLWPRCASLVQTDAERQQVEQRDLQPSEPVELQPGEQQRPAKMPELHTGAQQSRAGLVVWLLFEHDQQHGDRQQFERRRAETGRCRRQADREERRWRTESQIFLVHRQLSQQQHQPEQSEQLRRQGSGQIRILRCDAWQTRQCTERIK